MTENTRRSEPCRDPIVAEVRKAREAIFAEADYDIRRLCRQLREDQEKSGHPVLKRPPAPESVEETK